MPYLHRSFSAKVSSRLIFYSKLSSKSTFENVYRGIVQVCVCVCESERACVCVFVRERESECVYICSRARKRMCDYSNIRRLLRMRTAA